MQCIYDFINIISAIATWGLYLFGIREGINSIINRCEKKYAGKSFILIRDYIEACVDALLFLLPYITWIENNHIITSIS